MNESDYENTGPKYPDVHVQLVGKDGNAFSILGRVAQALRRNNVPEDEIKQFRQEATSGDYDNVLQTVMKWINVS